MAVKRHHKAGLAWTKADLLVVAGGETDEGPTSSVELLARAFDATSETAVEPGEKWHAAAPMPTPRLFISLCECRGKVLAVGGCNPDFETLATVESFSPPSVEAIGRQLGEWTVITPLKQEMYPYGLVAYPWGVFAGGIFGFACLFE